MYLALRFRRASRVLPSTCSRSGSLAITTGSGNLLGLNYIFDVLSQKRMIIAC
jgi:hypothetical protein